MKTKKEVTGTKERRTYTVTNRVNGTAGPLAKHIGQVMIELRMAKDWSQRDLARKAGVSQAGISLVERGARYPCLKSLVKISSTFEVPIQTFFREKK